MDCIFCNIVKGEVACNKIYEDEFILIFHDIDPQAQTHILAIPKNHISCCSEIDYTNSNIIARIFERISIISKDLKLDNGYRVVTNCGNDANQTVSHLHFHIVGGNKLNIKFC